MSNLILTYVLTFTLIITFTVSEIQAENHSSSKTSLQNCSLDDGASLFFYKKISSKPRDILYSTFSPVVYEFLTPNWTNPINPTDYTCTGDNYDVDGYSCPVLWYWLTQVRDSVQDDIFVENLKIRDASTFLPQNPNSCDEISQLLEGLYLSPEVRAEFLESISNNPCVGNRLIQPERIDDYLLTSAMMDSPYRRMREKFFEEYYQLQTPLNRSNDAMYTNMRLNIDDAGLSNYYRESQRWKEALKDCSNKKIPKGLLTPTELTSTLQAVSQGAEVSGFRLAISADKLSTYYKEPLVDCAFTEDSLLIVIQIPLQDAMAVWEEVDLISIPELKTSSSDGSKSICEMQDLDNQRPLLYEQGSRIIVEPNERVCLERSRLCNVPKVKSVGQWSMMKKLHSCPAYLLRDGNNAGMKAVCDYGCMSIDGLTPPMVKRVGSDRFIVVGGGSSSTESVRVVCPDMEDQYVTVSEDGGATEVQVPCGCVLVSPNYETVFEVRLPCSNEFTAFEIHSN